MRRIGIDVGGTNTDAVLIEDGKVSGAVKAPTSEDVTTGILDSLKSLSASGVLKDAGGALKKLDGVMIGTTHFINAVVQRRSLTKVAALRLGMPASASLPPFCDWPEDLAALVRGGVWMVEGGHEYDGRPFMPLDEAAVTRAAEEMKAAGLKSVGISAIFSPLDPTHERRAAELVAKVIPDAVITCSSDLGRIGLLERENAALLNAALADLSRETIAAFEKAIKDSGIAAPLFITQNDGTVAEAGQARRLPVYSFASGATNSMRGAAYLSGLADAMVIDVGGTTTDVGQLKNGFPREANSVVQVGGVRTLFRMPDLLSIGLGGGSHVQLDPLKVGPVSVGYRLLKEGIAFGGKQLTTTDIAVASGVLDARRQGQGRASRCGDLQEGVRRSRAPGRRGDRPDEDRGGRRAADRGRRRRLPDPGEAAGRVQGDPCAARRLRQCRRRRHRPGLGRMRPDLQGPEPHGCAGRGAGHRQRPRRGGGCRARLAGDHRERGHAVGLSAGQFRSGEGAGRRRRRRCRSCVVGELRAGERYVRAHHVSGAVTPRAAGDGGLECIRAALRLSEGARERSSCHRARIGHVSGTGDGGF